MRSMLALLLALAAANCGGGSNRSTCVAGAQQACACIGGGQGVQVCSPDGSQFGACKGCGPTGDDGGVDMSQPADASQPIDLTTLHDGSLDLPGPVDLSRVDAAPPSDMAASGPGCFALLGGASPVGSPARSKNLATAFLQCAANTCGDPMNTDGGASQPCSQSSDGGGPPAACDRCFSNVQVNNQITFTDASGNPIMCVNVDTGAGDANGLGCSGGLGACGSQIVACVLDCNSDQDCAGLMHGDGTGATCDLTSNQCM